MDEKKSLQSQAENMAMRPQEASEAQVKPEAPSEGGEKVETAEKAASEPVEVISEEVLESPKGQKTIILDDELMGPEQPMPAAPVVEKQAMAEVAAPKPAKKGHKGLVITIIVTIVLAIGAGVVWWFMAGPGKNTDTTQRDETIDNSENEKPSSEGGPRPVSTKPDNGGSYNGDDIPAEYETLYNAVYIVPTLFSRFDPSASIGNLDVVKSGLIDYGSYGAGRNEDISDRILMSMLVLLEQPVTCQGLTDYEKNEDGLSGFETRCFRADDISKWIKAYFNRDVDWLAFNESLESSTDRNWRYSPEYGLVIAGHCDYCGVNGPAPFNARFLVGVQEDGDMLYLMEKVAYVVQDPEIVYFHVPDSYDYGRTGEWVKMPENRLDIPSGTVINSSDSRYVEQFDTFRWVFRKIDGRYVFESIERVTE